jgi:hypothetical protein
MMLKAIATDLNTNEIHELKRESKAKDDTI